MRPAFLAALFVTLTAQASAQTPAAQASPAQVPSAQVPSVQAPSVQAPSAQAAFAERRALLEADRRCALFAPPMRAALEAAAGQARGALLRGGWTLVRLNELDSAARAAAEARACGDPRTELAAARARAAFQGWSHAHAMRFPAGARAWDARRTPDPADGWMLRQSVGAAVFGVRMEAGQERLSLIAPLEAGASPPPTAQMLVRDPARAAQSLMDVPGRLASGLEAGAPAPGVARAFLASSRRVETHAGVRRVIFTFPDAAFAALLTLDPRESAVILLGGAPQQRLLIEIGDVAAARAFLAAQG